MITQLRFNNFFSFADETTVDFVVGKKPTSSGFDIPLEGQRLNKVIAVVGPNGSGKTQLIKPFAFLSWFVCDSFLQVDPDADILYEPHQLHHDEDTHLEIDFVLPDETGQLLEHRYQLVMKHRRVVSEALFAKTSAQFSYIFKREKTAEGFAFRQKGFPLPAAQAKNLRDNASLLAAAFSFDVKEARPFIEYFRRVITNVTNKGRRRFQKNSVLLAAERYEKQLSIKTRMVEAVCEFDLGLSDIKIEKLEITAEDGKTSSIFMPLGVHVNAEGKKFELPFYEESSGTQSAFVLLERLLTTLNQGGIAVIDELDNELHPHLLPKILDWFRFEHTNPHQAQLIFTCHTPEILNRLQKHQVYLCEKLNQNSSGWRLDEVTGLRSDDNLYAKYMAGALGAVPEV
ncbi:MAG TPA: ATP-binding protein [Cellvibrionaceae bacterium]